MADDATTARRTDTSDPRASRLAALRVLYEADIRGEDIADALGRHAAGGTAAERVRRDASRGERAAPDADLGRATLDGFAVTLVRGVAAQRERIDARIARLSRGWRLERMPTIDRNVLRLAVHELETEPTPVAVVIDEAVRLVSELSTDDSGRFVNGILAAIAKESASSVDPAAPAAEES